MSSQTFTSLHEFLQRLENVKSSGGQFTARCPAHNDNHNSLSVAGKDGKILLHCHAGCSTESICAAMGLEMKGLYLESQPHVEGQQRRVAEIYGYYDEAYRLLYEVLRFEPKEFRHRRFDEHGKVIWNVKGTRRVPYRLPELIDALQKQPDRFVLLTEGEKDADNVRELGFTASSFKQWRYGFNVYVRGANIALLVDHDQGGIKQAEVAASIVSGAAASVKVVDLYEGEPLPEKHGKDVSDWLGEGHTADELKEIIGNAPFWNLSAVSAANSQDNEKSKGIAGTPLLVARLSEVKPEDVTWLWLPYIALGKVTILEGEEGLGKSWLTVALASAVSTGNGFPPDYEPITAGNVLMLSAEDGLADTIKPRLESCGADTNRVFALRQSLTLEGNDLIKLESVIAEYEPVLVTVDPLFAYTSPRTNINSANESRAVSSRLANMAEKYGCAMLLVRHIGKVKGYGDPRAAGLGSIDWRAAARSVLLVGKNQADESERAIVQTKNNLAPKGGSIGFTIEDTSNGPGFKWTGLSSLTEFQMLATVPDEEELTGRKDAIEFLLEVLKDGKQEVSEIMEQASELGISQKQLRTAREKLGVIPKKHGGGFGKHQKQYWTWSLPDVKTEDV